MIGKVLTVKNKSSLTLTSKNRKKYWNSYSGQTSTEHRYSFRLPYFPTRICSHQRKIIKGKQNQPQHEHEENVKQIFQKIRSATSQKIFFAPLCFPFSNHVINWIKRILILVGIMTQIQINIYK